MVNKYHGMTEEQQAAAILSIRLASDPTVTAKRKRYNASVSAALSYAFTLTEAQIINQLVARNPAYIRGLLATENERFGLGALQSRYAYTFYKSHEQPLLEAPMTEEQKMVERLRLYSQPLHPQQNAVPIWHACSEAAAMIERLVRERDEARKEALKEASELLETWAEGNAEYLRNAPSLLFASGPRRETEECRREAMAKHAWAYKNAAAAIRTRIGEA